MLTAAKADRIGFMDASDQVIVVFQLCERMVRFKISMPQDKPQLIRARWRSLVLCIKAKLESVRAGIEQFDEAFMPNIVMPDGKTLSEHALPQIATAYKSGKMPPDSPALTFQR